MVPSPDQHSVTQLITAVMYRFFLYYDFFSQDLFPTWTLLFYINELLISLLIFSFCFCTSLACESTFHIIGNSSLFGVRLTNRQGKNWILGHVFPPTLWSVVDTSLVSHGIEQYARNNHLKNEQDGFCFRVHFHPSPITPRSFSMESVVLQFQSLWTGPASPQFLPCPLCTAITYLKAHFLNT